MREGWLIDSEGHWIWNFHRDQKSWINEPKVFIHKGRRTSDGPPLLKERRHLKKAEADHLWASLQTQGWKRLAAPAWGDAVEI